jgi:hypothetical protein
MTFVELCLCKKIYEGNNNGINVPSFMGFLYFGILFIKRDLVGDVKHKLKDTIKMNLKPIKCEDVNCIQLPQLPVDPMGRYEHGN